MLHPKPARQRMVLLTLGLLLTMSGSLLANDTLKVKKPNSIHLGLKIQSGNVLQTNPLVVNIQPWESPLERFNAFSLLFLRQARGEEEWEQRYKYPAYGFGINVTNYDMRDQLGVPISLYAHFSSSFVRSRHFRWFYEINLGLAFNMEPYNFGGNEYYMALGTKRSVYISLGTGLIFDVSPRLSLGTSFAMSHFSNGAMTLPNKGINMVSPSLYFVYNTSKQRDHFVERELPEPDKYHEYIVSMYYGRKHKPFFEPYEEESDKEIVEYDQEYFLQYGLQLAYNKRISFKSKIGLAVDFLIDNAVRTRFAETDFVNGDREVTNSEKFALSLCPSYELAIHKTSIVIQPGFYVIRKDVTYDNPVFYQRLGIRQQFLKNAFLGVTVRAHKFRVAYFVEWMLGYRFR